MLEMRLARIPHALLGSFPALRRVPRRGGSLAPMPTSPPGFVLTTGAESSKAGPAPSAHHRAYKHS
eukprot:1486500-Amphidinium_carterae.1